MPTIANTVFTQLPIAAKSRYTKTVAYHGMVIIRVAAMVQMQHEVHSVVVIKISWCRRTAMININLNITMFILMQLRPEQSVLFISKNKTLLHLLAE